MFNAAEIRALLTAKDFRPFAIHTTDGARYETLNHDMLMVSKNSVDVGVAPDSDGVADRIVRCAIIYITRIEELQAA